MRTFWNTLATGVCALLLSWVSVNAYAAPTSQPAVSSNSPASVTQKAPVTQPTTKAAPTLVNRVVAIVNQDAITQLQLDQAIALANMQVEQQGMTPPDTLPFKRQVLQGLILQTIALQLATLNNINITPAEVTQTIDGLLQANHTTQAQLQETLQQFNVSYAVYRETIKDQMIITRLEQKAVAGSIFVTPQEIDTYLALRDKVANKNTEYDVSHILISLPVNPTPAEIQHYQQKADQLVADLRAHHLTFTKAAMEYSNAGDALSGGHLGYKTLNQLPTLFVQTIPSMKVGDIAGPLRDASGFHIFTLNGIKTPPTAQHYTTQYHVYSILIIPSPIMSDDHAVALLNQLKASLDQGKASFQTLAKTNSEDVNTRAQGGDMGWLALQTLPDPILAQHISNQPLNTVSAPFKTNSGWMIIQVVGKRQHNDTQDYLRQQAAQAIFRQKAESALQTWQQKLLGESYIHIVLPELRMDS